MNAVISEQAGADLARIRRWIDTSHGEEAATLFERRTETSLAQLCRYPQIGPRPHWPTRHTKLRFWVISRTRYLIFYELGPELVSIERVLDGRRDVRRVIEEGVEEPAEKD